MRVSFLTPRLPPFPCGVGDHTAMLARAVAALDVRVAFIYRQGTTVAEDMLDGPVSHWKGGRTALLKCVSEQAPDWLWIQLSGYGYSRCGAPYRLGRVLVHLQQQLGRKNDGVLEGRDIGTKVFPETPHKFFLTARPEVRAERRFRELVAKGENADFETVLAETVKRDQQDSTRADSPLSYDESYTIVDTSDRTIAEVVDAIVNEVTGHR